MKIIVEGHEIETREIVKIKEAGRRMHGFKIYLVGDRVIKIQRKEIYDMTPGECASINDRYRKLRNAVEEKWNEDKTDIPILNL